MLGLRSVRYISPVVAGSIVYGMQSPVYNDAPKRNFYEDDNEVVPVPGTTVPAAGSEIEMLGPNKLINGISVRTSSGLESIFKSIRANISAWYQSSQQVVDEQLNNYYTTERNVTNTVSGWHDNSEDLLPNSIYVMIGTLTGNIAARQRGPLAKLTFPIIFGLVSFKFFLPKTFSNTTGWFQQLERAKLPELAHQQDLAMAKADAAITGLEQSAEASNKYVKDTVVSLRKSIADITGLNIDEEVSKKK
ncbi:uncharacterized protein KQ657_004335 [Scheffersomyces spartinae]|uniref:MICOS complex subunit n=1 Tax=Scheffersomyces spartinae TaxID=45513 RepID=A0A9P7VB08_9ASCO|nr:uncharacterized protein KQ657_004335 [Scheffersomyces spartinae]KAG7194659.1 hypothetical protein KQ657_004335 [Scheffersomyces spartinae]